MGGLAHKIDLQTMATEEGALLLLRRASLLGPKDPIEQASPGNIATARQIAHELDGLPLALNQAGAYIEEKQCSLAQYLELYRAQPAQLLQRRGQPAKFFGHPDPVATTWQISFKNVEAANPAATELLRLCAFLAPDAIPEEIFSKGASELGPILQPIAADPLALNDAIGELLKYSLVRRDPTEQTLTIHRLVQKVLVDEMDEETRHLWAERCVKAVCNTFPNAEFKIWPACERLLSQGQTCISLIEQWNFSFEEAALLLSRVGFYLKERHGQLREVEALYRGACEMYERMLGAEHQGTLMMLNNLAVLYQTQGKYREAQELHEQVRAVRERVLGVEHPGTLMTLNNLAVLYEAQGKYREAQELYERVREMRERVLGVEHPDTLMTLNNLALLYQTQGKHGEAQELYERVRVVRERVSGVEHPDTLMTLHHLAALYEAQGKHKEAQELYERVRVVRERVLGAEHPETLTTLHNLAGLYEAQGKHEEAQELYERVRAGRERVLGAEHPHTAVTLYNLAAVYQAQGRYAEAEELYRRVLAIDEKVYGLYHREIVTDLRGLVELYEVQGRDEEARALLERVADIEGRL